MGQVNKDFITNFKEVNGYKIIYELDNLEISYKHIYIENGEQVGNYCIIVSVEDFYYLGEICENKIIRCWAKCSTLQEAYELL